MGKRSDRRQLPSRTQLSRMLVLCEGQCTEPEYLHELRRKLRIPEQNLMIVCPPEAPNTPREMVEEAKRRKRDKQDAFDQVWCVFDVEAKLDQKNRDGLLDALRSARDAQILIAMSNPCFEIWLLWHNSDQSAWIASHAVQRRCEELGLTHGKGGKHIRDAESLLRDSYQDARNRASSVDEAHDRNGTQKPEDRNPSSGMYLLIDAIYAVFPARS